MPPRSIAEVQHVTRYKILCFAVVFSAIFLNHFPADAKTPEFRNIINYSVGSFPSSIIAADFNNDGIPDVAINGVVDSSSCGLFVLLGRGDGRFTDFVTYPYPISSCANGMAVADFNHDGNFDVVIARANGATVFLGNGNGTLQNPVNYPIGESSIVAVADLNGDGNSDFVVTQIDTITVLLGNGDGNFQTPITFSPGHPAGYLAIGDLNGDGKPDLVLTTGSREPVHAIGVLIGNGDGTFQPEVRYPAQTCPAQLVLQDMNGDGALDLVVADVGEAIGGVSVRLGNGDGTFKPSIDYRTGQSSMHLTVGDFDGDGIPDVAATSWSRCGSFTVLLGKGDGTFVSRTVFLTLPIPGSLVMADFNGDGMLDLIVLDLSETEVWLNTGGGQPAITDSLRSSSKP